CNSTGCSGYRTSSPTTLSTESVPGLPSSISVPSANSTGSFTVSWGTASGTVTHYVLEQQKDGGSWSQVYSGSATSAGGAGLASGSYVHRVRACNSSGCGTNRTSTTTTVTLSAAPGVPSSISTPSSDSDGAFTVSWGASSGTVTSYVLEQQKDGGAYTQIYSGTTRSHAVSGLTGGSYRFRVKGCNGANCSS